MLCSVGDLVSIVGEIVDIDMCRQRCVISINQHLVPIGFEDLDDKTYESGFKHGQEFSNIYNQIVGKDNMYAVMQEIASMSNETRQSIFGYSTLENIVTHFTADFICDKLKGYNESKNKVRVGDVCIIGDKHKCIVTKAGDTLRVLMPNGEVVSDVSISDLRMTGEHIDVPFLNESSADENND